MYTDPGALLKDRRFWVGLDLAQFRIRNEESICGLELPLTFSCSVHQLQPWTMKYKFCN